MDDQLDRPSDQLSVAPKFALPFFPMRPRHSLPIRTVEDLARILAGNKDYDFSLKLNGDRACLLVQDGVVSVQNRHGAFYKMTVNRQPFIDLQGTWLLDGEIYKKEFLPFEVIMANNLSAPDCPLSRKIMAMELSNNLGIEWVYGRDNSDILSIAEKHIVRRDGSVIEGVVGKKLGSSYIPLGSESQESAAWKKYKWV
jgi:hypothetical protein